jgi:ribonuclease P protein component
VETITSSRDIDELFKHGRRAADPLLMVLCLPTPAGRPQAGRVVFVAGRKIGGAVLRNRCKRVLRASCRRVGGPWPGFDVALIARTATAHAPAPEVDAAVTRIVPRAGVPV